MLLKYSTRRLILILTVAVLASCTHVETVPLDVNFDSGFSDANALTRVEPKTSFVKGQFEDKRSDTKLLASFKQQVHTFNLVADKPLDDVLFYGLSQLIEKSGHSIVQENARIKMDVTVLNVQAARNAGMMMVGADSSIQLKLDFIDNKTGKLFYSQIYNGKDSRENAMLGLMSMVFDSINASIANCINQVGQDEAFANALRSL